MEDTAKKITGTKEFENTFDEVVPKETKASAEFMNKLIEQLLSNDTYLKALTEQILTTLDNKAAANHSHDYVTSIKGDNETEYRTGQINITTENIGALPFKGNALTATKATQDGNGNNIVNTYQTKTGDTVNNTVSFTQSTSRTNISTGEKHSVLFGKINKWFSELKNIAFSGSYSDLSNKPLSLKNPNSITVNGQTYDGSSTVNVSTIGIAYGGTGASNASNARNNLGLGSAATKSATDSITSDSSSLITSGAVYNAKQELDNKINTINNDLTKLNSIKLLKKTGNTEIGGDFFIAYNAKILSIVIDTPNVKFKGEEFINIYDMTYIKVYNSDDTPYNGTLTLLALIKNAK